MRRLSGFLLAAAIMVLPTFSPLGTAYAQEAQTFNGDTAILSYAINSDKTADYEEVMAKVREALLQSDSTQRNQQAAGWKVLKSGSPMPDGNIVYTHLINPVVSGADYAIMAILYEAFEDPAERTRLYDLYSGAFAAALGGGDYSVAVDLSRP
jgi:hypothetical protein